MSVLQAIILGMIQGITEFLPVSSSGHLLLGQILLGIDHLDQYLTFDLVCHLGTLIAICAVFAKDIYETLTNRTKLYLVFLGTLPLFPLALIFKPIKSLFDQPQFLGFFFLWTSLLLFLGIRFANRMETLFPQKNPKRDSLWIGFFQSLAVLPGVSRSGSTISCARLLGWNYQEAISFSFLLAIPATLGGIFLEIISMIKQPSLELPPISLREYTAGFLTSLLMGYLSLRLIQTTIMKQHFIYFSLYCLFLGIFTMIYFW